MLNSHRILFSFLIAGGVSLRSQQYVISTVAGVPLTSQRTPALGAEIGSPGFVAADSAGNVYFSVRSASTLMYLIYKVDPNGVLSHVAGQLRPGGALGDGGPAANASLGGGSGYTAWTLGNPAIALDAKGNLYIADTSNDRVRRISTDGLIDTVAGNGQHGASGDGGPATNAQLRSPMGVAVDSAGNLYIADTENYQVRKVSTDGISLPPSRAATPIPPSMATVTSATTARPTTPFSTTQQAWRLMLPATSISLTHLVTVFARSIPAASSLLSPGRVRRGGSFPPIRRTLAMVVRQRRFIFGSPSASRSIRRATCTSRMTAAATLGSAMRPTASERSHRPALSPRSPEARSQGIRATVAAPRAPG